MEDVAVTYLIEFGDFDSIPGEDIVIAEVIVFNLRGPQTAYKQTWARARDEIQSLRRIIDEENPQRVGVSCPSSTAETHSG